MSYEHILSKIRETKALIEERKKTFSDAENSVETLENRIAESSDFIDASQFKEKLDEVKDAFSRNNYADAFRLSASCQTEISSSLESWQPNVKIELPKDLISGKWQKYSIKITNEGSAHASQIVVKFSEGVKQQGSIEVKSLRSGQFVDVEANLVSEFAGSVNVKANIISRILKRLASGCSHVIGASFSTAAIVHTSTCMFRFFTQRSPGGREACRWLRNSHLGPAGQANYLLFIPY